MNFENQFEKQIKMPYHMFYTYVSSYHYGSADASEGFQPGGKLFHKCYIYVTSHHYVYQYAF